MKWFVLLSALCGLGLAGCSGRKDETRGLVVWTAYEGDELKALQELCSQASPPAEVLAVPFAGLKNKVLVAAPAGQGPDVVVGPQDWLGVFSAAGLLEPMPPELADELKQQVSPVALDGVTYNGKVYAYPLLLEGLALLRNTKLAPRSPKTVDELRDYAVEIEKEGKVHGFSYDLRELYFSWPFFSAFGATVFKPGGLEPGMTGPEGVAATEYLKSLRDTKLIQLGTTNDFAKTDFLDGKLAMTLNGPWFLGDLRKRGVPYAIEPVPPATHPARSFIGVSGLMLNSDSMHQKDAIALIRFLGSEAAETRLALSSGRVPARKDAQADAARDPVKGPDIQAFTRVVNAGVAMPNHPAANAVWDPMKQSLELISKGEVDPGPELAHTRDTIDEKIRRMVE